MATIGFGLQIRKGVTAASVPKPAPKVTAIFAAAEDDSEEEELRNDRQGVNKALQLESLRQQSSKKVHDEQARVLADDPTAYNYDELYDDMDAARRAKDPRLQSKDKATRQDPKYMANLLLNAERRKRDEELRLERAAQRERVREGDEFEGKEEFVTQAYKDKMVELRKLQEEQDRLEAIERSQDVVKRGDMMAFHKNLLTELDTGVNVTEATLKTRKSEADAVAKAQYIPDKRTSQERQRRLELAQQVQVEIERKRRAEESAEVAEIAEKYARKTTDAAAADARARFLARKQKQLQEAKPSLDDDE